MTVSGRKAELTQRLRKHDRWRLVSFQKYNALTVDVLRGMLRMRFEKRTGRKQELIDRLIASDNKQITQGLTLGRRKLRRNNAGRE